MREEKESHGFKDIVWHYSKFVLQSKHPTKIPKHVLSGLVLQNGASKTVE